MPLVAVHLFVFYFGLMADVHPPAGLAAYAAAAISGADPIKTGLQGFWYEIRTGLLPFIFIFNTELLLIDVCDAAHFTLIVGCSIIAKADAGRGVLMDLAVWRCNNAVTWSCRPCRIAK